MGRTVHFAFFSLLLTFSLCSQNTASIDSLIRVATAGKNDTGKVNALNKLSEQLRRRDTDTALYYAAQAVKLADKLSYKKGIIRALNNTGIVLRYKGEFDKALKEHERALKFSNEINDKACISTSRNSMGNIYFMLGKYSEAALEYSASLKADEETGDTSGMGSAHNNLGLVYSSQGNFPEALKHYFASLKISEATGDKETIAYARNNMGMIYFRQGNFTAAQKEHLAALQASEESGDKRALAATHNNLGILYAEQKNYKSALAEYEKAKKYKEEMGDRQGVATSHNNIGIIYFHLKEYANALHEYEESLKIKEDIGDVTGVAATRLNIGTLYIEMNKPALAQTELLKTIRTAEEAGEIGMLENAYLALSHADSALGNWSSAYTNYRKYVLYRDSTINEENTKKTVQAQMQYEFDKRESAKKAEQAKKDLIAAAEKRRAAIVLWCVISGFALVLIFAIIIFRAFKQKQSANREIIHQKEIIEEKQKEILDSIYYARRIQRALITSERYFEKHLRRLNKLHLLLLSFTFICLNLSAKDPRDSLRSICFSNSAADTVRYNAALETGFSFQFTNSDSALRYFSLALKIAELANDKLRKGEALRQLGNIYDMLDERDKALEFFSQSRTIAESCIGNASGIKEKYNAQKLFAYTLGNVGLVLLNQGKYEEALMNFTAAWKINIGLGNMKSVANNLTNIGNVYSSWGRYPEAVSFYLKAASISERTGNLRNLATNYANIGISFKNLENPDEALRYYSKADSILILQNNTYARAKLLGNISNVYIQKHDYETALKIFNESLNINKEFGNNTNEVANLVNLGVLHLRLGEQKSGRQEGKKHFLESEQVFTKALDSCGPDDKLSRAIILGNLAAVQINLKKFRLSEKNAKESLEIAGQLHSFKEMKFAYKALYELYEQTREYDKSYAYYKQYVAYCDSISNEENTKKQTRLQMQYEFDRKEAAAKANQDKKDALAAEEKNKERLILWSVTGSFILVLVFSLFVLKAYREKKKANIQISLQKEVIEEKQKEILDSIYYAGRIQRALITSERYVDKHLRRMININVCWLIIYLTV